MLSDRERLLRLVKKSTRRGHFKLTTGKESSLYIDGRNFTLNSLGLYLATKLLSKKIRPEVTVLGGPTLGADPLIGGILLYQQARRKKQLKGLLVRKEAKKHALKNLVEGPAVKIGEKAVILDDTATTGASLLKTKRALEEKGLKVVQALVIVDRNEGARENLAQAGLALESLFDINDLV
ncbi:MAG: orotate phosphoribosyltransferase [Candidatus Yanofskybacteria bacterium CG10_big_fil_rev_8_21_14_0_10_46_23]|uniref:Orotate phosphoribosyltransferase n=1 Tax=Candidatus Yanofskybacteria bacterium CG10_big_fil_rev_8_21_14_0_10_46_23 TaxID=1975098 RepID=A0A2H0R498_9BACT|nr:MAG: orotate phosphoribosyltransferase [Candidatus Yanofskybacteria bacterium CG10_big_fil_rev_8_21_14_0_10_46_23]